eukprot:scaffold174082_cov18-Tisochrysis_lutea.AAC.2
MGSSQVPCHFPMLPSGHQHRAPRDGDAAVLAGQEQPVGQAGASGGEGLWCGCLIGVWHWACEEVCFPCLKETPQSHQAAKVALAGEHKPAARAALSATQHLSRIL